MLHHGWPSPAREEVEMSALLSFTMTMTTCSAFGTKLFDC